MKYKNLLLIVPFVLVAMVVNSCKKDTQGHIATLFTGGTWQVASVTAYHFTGNTLDSTQVLDTACTRSQFFTFNTDNTCTFTNYDCIEQTPASAKWTLTPDQLYLEASVVCKDTTAAGTSTPFANARILNLGQFSLVLQIGDIATNYSLTKKRLILQYGFIRQKTATTN